MPAPSSSFQGSEATRHAHAGASPRAPPPSSPLSDAMDPVEAVRQVSFAELERATAGWAHVLGQGGFGAVYRGRWEGVPVAVKRMRDRSRIADFTREVTFAASTARHDRLARVLAVCDDRVGDRRCVVYPLARCSLEDRLHRRGASKSTKPMPPGVRVRCAAEIADGVRYVHDRCGWLIRDLKSANVLLDDRMHASITDLGKAIPAAQLRRSVTERASCAAETDAADEGRDARGGMGMACVAARYATTEGYVSPEVAAGEVGFEAADVFSLGVVLFELLTGLPPLMPTRKPSRLVDYALAKMEMESAGAEAARARVGDESSAPGRARALGETRDASGGPHSPAPDWDASGVLNGGGGWRAVSDATVDWGAAGDAAVTLAAAARRCVARDPRDRPTPGQSHALLSTAVNDSLVDQEVTLDASIAHVIGVMGSPHGSSASLRELDGAWGGSGERTATTTTRSAAASAPPSKASVARAAAAAATTTNNGAREPRRAPERVGRNSSPLRAAADAAYDTGAALIEEMTSDRCRTGRSWAPQRVERAVEVETREVETREAEEGAEKEGVAEADEEGAEEERATEREDTHWLSPAMPPTASVLTPADEGCTLSRGDDALGLQSVCPSSVPSGGSVRAEPLPFAAHHGGSIDALMMKLRAGRTEARVRRRALIEASSGVIDVHRRSASARANDGLTTRFDELTLPAGARVDAAAVARRNRHRLEAMWDKQPCDADLADGADVSRRRDALAGSRDAWRPVTVHGACAREEARGEGFNGRIVGAGSNARGLSARTAARQPRATGKYGIDVTRRRQQTPRT